ncbi:hypothetical protein [Geofilum rubicundum]|uniref:hypothetical protein n=1 Tax=Geofilum rubicundum TaxID=472113 RepID=UPI0012F7DAC9|nr:hypothetical protein [Geofilum rubicundum]
MIFFQAGLMAVLIYLFFKYFIKLPEYPLWALGFITFITGFTTASVTVSTIEPHIFSGLSVLSGGILLFAKEICRRDFILVSVIFVFSCSMDPSNMLSMVFLSTLFMIFGLISVRRKGTELLQKSVLVLAFTIISILMVSFIHHGVGGKFSPVNSYHTAILPGLMTTEQFQASLMQNPEGMEDKLDSLLDSKSLEMVQENDFVRAHGIYSAQNAIREMVALETDDAIMFSDSTVTLRAVFDYYNHEVRDVFISRQIFKIMQVKTWGGVQVWVSLAGLLLGVFVLKRHKNSSGYGFVIYLMAGWPVLAFCNSVFYGQAGLQSHLAWLWVFPMFIFFRESKAVQQHLSRISAILSINVISKTT